MQRELCVCAPNMLAQTLVGNAVNIHAKNSIRAYRKVPRGIVLVRQFGWAHHGQRTDWYSICSGR